MNGIRDRRQSHPGCDSPGTGRDGGRCGSILIIALIFLFPVTGAVHAEIIEGTSDLSAYAGIFGPAGEDPALLAGARYSYNFSETRSIESFVGAAFPEETTVLTVMVNYRLNFTTPVETLVLDVAGGGGFARVSSDHGNGGTSTDFLLDFGGGVLCFVNDYVGLRLDVREHVVPGDESAADGLEVSAGVSYFIY